MNKKARQALHQKSVAELQTELAAMILELGQKLVERAADKLENKSSVKTLSDNIARYKTVLRIKELAQ